LTCPVFPWVLPYYWHNQIFQNHLLCFSCLSSSGPNPQGVLVLFNGNGYLQTKAWNHCGSYYWKHQKLTFSLMELCNPLSKFFVCLFSNAGDEIQGFANAEQKLYHWAAPPPLCIKQTIYENIEKTLHLFPHPCTKFIFYFLYFLS
jgi:hypothetical protein